MLAPPYGRLAPPPMGNPGSAPAVTDDCAWKCQGTFNTFQYFSKRVKTRKKHSFVKHIACDVFPLKFSNSVMKPVRVVQVETTE